MPPGWPCAELLASPSGPACDRFLLMAMPSPRTAATEGRLRKRRSDARVHLRIAADASLLTSHRASAAPVSCECCCSSGARVVRLLEALLTQQCALCETISGFRGFQAGSVGYNGAYFADQPTYGTGVCAGDDATDDNVPDEGFGLSVVNSSVSGVQPGRNGFVDLGGATSEGDCCMAGDSLASSVANKVMGTSWLSYKDVTASNDFGNSRADLTDMQDVLSTSSAIQASQSIGICAAL